MRPSLSKSRGRISKCVPGRGRRCLTDPRNVNGATGHYLETTLFNANLFLKPNRFTANLWKAHGSNDAKTLALKIHLHYQAIYNASNTACYSHSDVQQLQAQANQKTLEIFNAYKTKAKHNIELQKSNLDLEKHNEELQKSIVDLQKQLRLSEERCKLYMKQYKLASISESFGTKQELNNEQERRRQSLLAYDSHSQPLQGLKSNSTSGLIDHRRAQNARRYSEGLSQSTRRNSTRRTSIQWVACNDPPGVIDRPSAKSELVEAEPTTLPSVNRHNNDHSNNNSNGNNNNSTVNQSMLDTKNMGTTTTATTAAVPTGSTVMQEVTQNNLNLNNEQKRLQRGNLEEMTWLQHFVQQQQNTKKTQKIIEVQREKLSNRNRDLYSSTSPIQPRFLHQNAGNQSLRKSVSADHFRRTSTNTIHSGELNNHRGNNTLPDRSLWQDEKMSRRFSHLQNE
ncbi:hypothetical protein BDF19DRAFT_423714 [Syncephalis fuscata]|nr:hypothetical protein BDF19DRAFT_423714 [Syncephalis fuscata]